MKLRALAIVAALAVPGLASAVPADVPPTNPPSNSPSSDPTSPTPDQSPVRDQSPTNPADKTTPGKLPSEANRTGDKGDKTGDKSGDMKGDKTGDMKGAKLSDADTKIIGHLHHVNQMEINLGQIAQKAGTAHVKDYAKTLISDHQSADKDLTAFAKSHKVAAIPADKPMTDADRQDDKDMTTAMAHLKTLKGAEFDKEYLNMMVSGHDKELTKIDVAISGATDPDLKSMLQTVKPVLQRHADQARDLQKSPQASANMTPDKQPSSK
jgi:putative membrane protein